MNSEIKKQNVLTKIKLNVDVCKMITFHFQIRENPATLNIPTLTPAPDRGFPVACLGGPVACLGQSGGFSMTECGLIILRIPDIMNVEVCRRSRNGIDPPLAQRRSEYLYRASGSNETINCRQKRSPRFL